MNEVTLARRLAYKAHEGLRYSGRPYTFHLGGVAAVVSNLRDVGYDAAVVAWLHDIIEDTDVEDTDLLHAGITLKNVGRVSVLTHRKDEPYVDYIDRVCATGDRVALLVKKADLEFNIAHADTAQFSRMADKKWWPALRKVLVALR